MGTESDRSRGMAALAAALYDVGGAAGSGSGWARRHTAALAFASCSHKRRDYLVATSKKGWLVVIVAGQITVAPEARERYLAGCVSIVAKARAADGCLDFSITPDLIEAGRINIYERWASQAAVEAFRGGGPSDEQSETMLTASVAEYDVAGTRVLADKR